jgi:hypothetical protein
MKFILDLKDAPHLPGVYVVLAVEYVGQSKDIHNRLVGHSVYDNEKHFAAYIELDDIEERRQKEGELIRYFDPPKNYVGTLRQSKYMKSLKRGFIP